MSSERLQKSPVSIGETALRICGVILISTILFGTALSAQQLPLVNYTTEEGLSYPQAWCVFQDSRGYIWIGTSEGISRFDGLDFLNYSAKDGLQNQTIRTIAEDKRGWLWLGTDDGIERFDGRTFKHFGETQGLGKGTIWACTKDRRGRLWFGTQYGGVSVLEGDHFRTFDKAAGLASDYVYSLLADSKGNLWLGHRGHGVTRCRIDDSGSLADCHAIGPDSTLAKAEVRAIVEDNEGNVYFGTRGTGVTRFDGSRLVHFGKEVGLPGDDIYAMLVNHRNEIVIGGLTKGVAICSAPDLSPCRSFDVQNGLIDNNVTGLLEDRDDDLWMALDSGVAKLPTEKFISFTSREGLPHHTIYSLLREPNGVLWIGTVGGLARMQPNDDPNRVPKIDAWRPNTVLPGNEVWDILRDSRGRLWIATEGGLCEFADGRCKRVLTQKNGLGATDLITLFEDRDHGIWVGTVDGATRMTFKGSSNVPTMRTIRAQDGLAGDFVYVFVEDDLGRIWMGTDHGLSVLDHGKIHSWTTAKGLPFNEIFDMAIDQSNTMWIGTNGGGLLSFPLPGSLDKTPSFRVWGAKSGVPDVIGVVTPRRNGQVWLGTNIGELLFDPSASNGRGGIVRRFDRASGLVSSEINAVTRGPGGRLWIGTTGGLTLYEPSLEDAPIHPPLVTIEGLRVFGGTTWHATFSATTTTSAKISWLRAAPISLAHDFGTLRIDYRGLSFRERSGIRYRYMLRGFDSNWSEPTTENFKEYTNLDPGNYTFVVRAGARGSTWSRPAEIAFVISPAWWQRTSFKVGLVLGLVLLLTFGYKARMYTVSVRNTELERAVSERTDDLRRYARALEEHSRALDQANLRIRQADKVKSEFLANMSHELRTPLNSIIGFSEVLMPRLEGRIEPRESRFLSNVRSSGRYLLLLINNLLDLSKIEAGRMELHLERVDLGELIESTCAVVQGYASERGIEIAWTVDPGLPEVTVDVAKFKQILLNLLSNAVKFSPPKGRVSVEVREIDADRSPIHGESWELAVRDEGPGIGETDREIIFQEFRQVGGGSAHPGGTGLGLALVRRFVSLMGGRVDLDSTVGQGSTFRVTLPVVAENMVEEGGGWDDPTDTSLIRPRVLVVESRRETFSSLASTLDREGFLPVRAPDTSEAMRMLLEIHPAVVVLDLLLPDFRGWSFLSTLDQSDVGHDLPLIFCLQANGNRPALAAGVDTVILEPLESHALVDALQVGREPDRDDHHAPVLIVAEADRANALGARLKEADIATISTASSQEGLSIASVETPSAVVVDLGMPDLRGFCFVQRLQQDRATSHTPVFAIGPRKLDTIRADAVPRAESSPSADELAITLHELLRRRSARAVRSAAAGLSGSNETEKTSGVNPRRWEKP